MNTALRRAFTVQSRNQSLIPFIKCQPFASINNRRSAPKGNGTEADLFDDFEDEDINFEELKADIKKHYTKRFQKIKFESESLIKSYEQGLATVAPDIETQQLKIKNKKLEEATRKHFSDITLKEFMNRSKNLSDSMRLKTAWSPYDKPDAYQNSFDYEKYNGNQVKMEDYIHDPDDNGEYDGKAIQDFMEKKLGKEEIINPTPVEEKDAQAAQEEVMGERAERLLDFGMDPDLVPWDKIFPGDIEDGTGDSMPMPLIIQPVMSQEAKAEIYRLHLQGWSVRDLSIRFGIMPRRVKAIVWFEQTFYDEYLPRMTIEDVRELVKIIPIAYPNTVDYGLDLEYMAKSKQGVRLRRFRMKPEDLNPSKEQTEKMNKVLETKQRKKWDAVTEDFVGRGSRGYFIKSWHVYRGHGSERVNKKFRDVIQQADRPYLLPKKVRKALDEGKGPRLASLGWGIK